MPRTYTPPQPFSDKPRPDIKLTRVESSQVHAVGYDEATRTLGVQFHAPGQHDVLPLARAPGNVYFYPDVAPETYQALILADSIGSAFGKFVKPLTVFDKFPPLALETQS